MTLREGFQMAGYQTIICSGHYPDDPRLPKLKENYDKNILRVMRQVHYQTAGRKSLDLVFFINGIPVATAEVKTELKPADTPPTTAALRDESAKLNARIKELTSDQRDKKGKIIKYGYQMERENVETLRPIYARKAQIDRQLALVDAQEIPENKWIGKGFGASFVYKDNPKDGEDPYMISSYGTGVILQDGSRAIKVTLGSKVTYHKIESGQRYFPNDMYMGTLRKPEIMLYPGEEIPGAVERQ